jgi:hypothetical protein
VKSPPFAAGTEVPVARTRAEIETALTRAGATSFVVGWEGTKAAVMFTAHGRRVRFTLDVPVADDKRFARDGRGVLRAPSARVAAAEAEERRRWRALLFVIRAKLEAVASGVSLFEDEFLAQTVVPTPNGSATVGDWLRPQIARAYEAGAAMPPLLGAGSS